MFKLMTLLLGIGVGAAGGIAWLLSEPGTMSPPNGAGTSGGFTGRVSALKARLAQAAADGKIAGSATEVRLQRELDVDRGHTGGAIAH
jgi:hypothetical protein